MAVSGGQIVLSLSRTRALIVGFFSEDAKNGPSGRGRESNVGIVRCGKSDEGSVRAYARVKRRAGRFERNGIA